MYYEKNRYSDILTYKDTSVKLQKSVDIKSMPESDYINACYIDSPFGAKKIIAS